MGQSRFSLRRANRFRRLPRAPEPGGGDFEKEFAHFEIELSSRMRRMEEAIEILRLTSSRENVDYEGQYWRFRNLTVLPRLVQQPVPIWVAANPDLKKRGTLSKSYPAGGTARRRMDDHLQIARRGARRRLR